jgi:hypothetical protein
MKQKQYMKTENGRHELLNTFRLGNNNNNTTEMIDRTFVDMVMRPQTAIHKL